MAKLNRSDSASPNYGPGSIDINQGQFRGQQDVIGDGLLQLGASGESSQGATINNPLNAPFILYVNPYTGRDDVVLGSYTTNDNDDVDTELRRIESQRLVCGYTEAAPFKTINRAVIEAGIITCKNYFDNAGAEYQRVSIILAPGNYDIDNQAGTAASAVNAYSADTIDAAWLRQFNPETVGGIILPRGCSVVSLDLRKTILRPVSGGVPAPADEDPSYSNRRAILRLTGECYVYGVTFMDALNASTSHHLLSCFEYASKSQLDDFYTKLNRKFAGVADAKLDTPTTRVTEYEIVGPQPASLGADAADTDTTASASPYIFNSSIRSEYGLCGVFANGAVSGTLGGFRSMVMANFTGVSLQKDMSSWERFASGSWTTTNYTQYVNTSPDDLRMVPARRSFHIRAVNKAVIQEVSVFCIGQGVHNWCQSGGELTVTNSNSNFGGVAALAEGYNDEAFPQDDSFTATHQRVPTDLRDETNNIRQIYLGTIASVTGNAITLTSALTGDTDNEPNELGDYTLVPGSYLWIESPITADYRAQLASTAWDESGNKAIINVTSSPVTDTNDDNKAPGDNIVVGGTDTGVDYPAFAGLRVYIRRLIDTRTQEKRQYALLLDQPGDSRPPQRDYVLRTDGDSVGNASFTDVAVMKAGPTILYGGTAPKTQVELKQINPDAAFKANTVYRPGDSIVTSTKHYICVKEVKSGASISNAFLTANFQENFVHMPTGAKGVGYMPEDYFKNTQPTLIFDDDFSEAETVSTTTPLGWILNEATTGNVWEGSNPRDLKVQAQYKSATDYKGLERYLTQKSLTIASPRTPTTRDVAITNQSNQEFRRPSTLRLYAHSFEWSGFANYTKGLPRYQKEMSGGNKFTYYGTSERGGRAYFTGFNEEGFRVSPRGIEDIQTGEIQAQEEINAPDAGLVVPTFFNELNVNELTVSKTLALGNTTVSGSPNWGNTLPTASSDEKGIVELATLAEVITGTDTERAVTPAILANRITALTAAINASIPTGTVVQTASNAGSAPSGWLYCRGQAVSRTTYSGLFTAIGESYGAGDGSTTFNVPNMLGRFPRGFNTGDASQPDNGRTWGSTQTDALENHGHSVTDPGHQHSAASVGGAESNQSRDLSYCGGSTTSTNTTGITIADNSVTNATANANETRPDNVVFNYLIKT